MQPHPQSPLMPPAMSVLNQASASVKSKVTCDIRVPTLLAIASNENVSFPIARLAAVVRKMSSPLSLRFLLVLSSFYLCAVAYPASVHVSGSRNITSALFEELEELSRIVDISYCVGSSGIQKPFQCLGRCSDFEGFELVTVGHLHPMLFAFGTHILSDMEYGPPPL